MKTIVLISFLAGCLSLLADDMDTIVVTNDCGQPVTADIWKQTGSSYDRIGHTESDGRLIAAIGCKQGQLIIIKPDEDATYFQKRNVECPLHGETYVKVTRRTRQAKLLADALKASDKGDYLTASKLYSELAANADDYDPNAAAVFQKNGLDALGKQFKVDDPIQVSSTTSQWEVGTVVSAELSMSDALKDKLAAHYGTNGFPADYNLDEQMGRKTQINAFTESGANSRLIWDFPFGL